MSIKEIPTLEAEWENYRAKVIPHVAVESVQYEETQKAFYAGALVLYATTMALPSLDEQVAMEILDNLSNSLTAFSSMVKRRNLQRHAERN